MSCWLHSTQTGSTIRTWQALTLNAFSELQKSKTRSSCLRMLHARAHSLRACVKREVRADSIQSTAQCQQHRRYLSCRLVGRRGLANLGAFLLSVSGIPGCLHKRSATADRRAAQWNKQALRAFRSSRFETLPCAVPVHAPVALLVVFAGTYTPS